MDYDARLRVGGKPTRISDLEMTMVPLFLGAGRGRHIMAAAAFGLLLSACTATPEQKMLGPSADNAVAPVPPTAYRSVLSGYVSQQPVEPAPWREQNERVTPAPKK